jgi:hypothetical protein
MDGGPGTVYAPRAWDAYLEFSDSAIDSTLDAALARTARHTTS